MTIDFRYEIQIRLLNPGTSADTVPVHFKLNNFMLREAIRIFRFSGRLSRSI